MVLWYGGEEAMMKMMGSERGKGEEERVVHDMLVTELYD